MPSTEAMPGQSSLSSILENTKWFLCFKSATQPLAQGDFPTTFAPNDFLAHILGVQLLSTATRPGLSLSNPSFSTLPPFILSTYPNPQTLKIQASWNPECFPHPLPMGEKNVYSVEICICSRNMGVLAFYWVGQRILSVGWYGKIWTNFLVNTIWLLAADRGNIATFSLSKPLSQAL